MITTIYANHGVLAHEYQTVYTTAPHEHAVVFEKIAVEIPDSFEPYHNHLDEIVIRIPGLPWPYMLSEVLTTVKGKLPGMRWYDGRKGHTVALEIVETDAQNDASTTIWYAVMRDHEDTDWGMGSYSLHEAKCKARSLRASGCGDAHIAVVEESKHDKVVINLIHDLD